MPDTQLPDRRAPQGWHLKKEVNISMILAILTIGLSSVAAYFDLKREIALLQADRVVLHQRDTQMAVDNDSDNKVLSARLDKIDSKLDRLIERVSK